MFPRHMQVSIPLGRLATQAELLFGAGSSVPLMPSHWAELLGRTLFVGADTPLGNVKMPARDT